MQNFEDCRFKQGNKVFVKAETVNSPQLITGTICGVATTGQPFIGRNYIVDLDITFPEYPYSHACFFEFQLEKM